jgi:hypothetical protein
LRDLGKHLVSGGFPADNGPLRVLEPNLFARLLIGQNQSFGGVGGDDIA